MLRRENGLDYFFQWDYNQRLIVDNKDITEVHFCNKITNCSYVCETYTENNVLLVNVPNILLQTDWEIEAYAYVGNCIRFNERFDIVSRAKPDNYIYEETEILNYDTLVSRMETIEDSIPGAVADYMEANPIKFPVDSVNGKTGAVKLTAADVGALPADTVIPSTVGLATEKYVDDKVAAIPQPDLSGYATKNDINGLATTNYVDEKVSGVKVDLSDYATKTFVSEEIAKIEDVDLTNYYTKSETDTAIGEAVAAVPQPDLTDYAKKSDIPDTTGFATEDYVDEAIANIPTSGGSVAVDGETILQNADGTISTAIGGYRTEPQVIYTWTGSTPAGEEVEGIDISPFEDLEVDETLTITYTVDGVEYTEEFNVDTKSLAKIIASNNDDGLLTEVVIGIRYETMTYEFEGTALTAVSITNSGSYVCINSNYINIGAGLERVGSEIVVNDSYIQDLIPVPEADGTTIVADKRGRISTSIGGAVITTPDEVYFNYTDEPIFLFDSIPVDAGLADPNNLENLEDGTDVIVTIVVDGDEYVIETTASNDGTTVRMDLSSEPIFSNFEFNIDNNTFILVPGSDAEPEMEVPDITIAVPGSVAYEHIDSNVVNIGTGLKIDNRGLIVVDAAYIESIIANYLASNGGV